MYVYKSRSNMILNHCAVLLMFLSFVRTKEYAYDYGLQNAITEIEQRYSYWPSMHNALSLRKRDVKSSEMSEGGGEVSNDQLESEHVTAALPQVEAKGSMGTLKSSELQHSTVVVKGQLLPNNETFNSTVLTSSGNDTITPKQLDLKNPGVLMRGVIVFGGFLILAVAYYIFYRKKTNKNEASNAHNTNDTNQFRYGVLHSEDRRDNMELSRVPLTMESDEEEDEDLEIFDLGQKKQSLSYVNLHTNDEDIVFQRPENGSGDKSNLLLDIEDASTDPLINWSNNGNKSIL